VLKLVIWCYFIAYSQVGEFLLCFLLESIEGGLVECNRVGRGEDADVGDDVFHIWGAEAVAVVCD